MRLPHVLFGFVFAAAGLPLALGGPPKPASRLDRQQRIEQALNRLTWGPAPGDAARVEAMGLDRWIDLQLHPGRIAENPALAADLAALDSLGMSTTEMIEHYPPPQAIRQMALGKMPLPQDPAARALAVRELEQYRARMDNKADGSTPAPDSKPARVDATVAAIAPPAPPDEPVPAPLRALLSPEQVQSLRRGAPAQRVAALEALTPDLRDQVLAALPRPLAGSMLPWLPLAQQRVLEIDLQPQQLTVNDLIDQKLIRAVETNRQLEDVLTDFWFNHFNVYINKGADRYLITAYERDAIRPHVLDRFSDLLLATARSPAMLFYLDNWQSVAPRPQFAPVEPTRAGFMPAPPAARRGLNENYGREVMELHTLGVNGGYTQQDVINVARCFTGWTIRQIDRNPEFFYNDRLHDKGEKVVLGVTIPAGGGMDDGLKVIDLLARNPATAHHLSYELAQRFVSDDPPASLVDRMTQAWLAHDGDLREVMRTMLASPEFWHPQYFRAKVKSPLEMTISAVRASGATLYNPTRLSQVVAQMGEPLYGKEPPTGYANEGAPWVSSSALVARLNFALQLSADTFPGIRVDLAALVPPEATATEATDRLLQSLLAGDVSASTRATIARFVGGAAGSSPAVAQPVAPAQLQRIAGLILGSPEFQRH